MHITNNARKKTGREVGTARRVEPLLPVAAWYAGSEGVYKEREPQRGKQIAPHNSEIPPSLIHPLIDTSQSTPTCKQ